MTLTRLGEVITFYSYKGGTGPCELTVPIVPNTILASMLAVWPWPEERIRKQRRYSKKSWTLAKVYGNTW